MKEWRQFRLLSRDSIRQLINAAMLQRDGDPMQFAIWVGAPVLAIPFIVSVRLLMRYSGAPSYAALEPLLLQNRMFFLIYGMFAAAALAVVTWEALFPSQADQEALGALPVRPRTAAAARLTGAIGLAAGVLGALAVPPAVLFTITALASPSPWSAPLVLVAHAGAIVGGPLFIFLALLTLRALISLLLGAAAAERMAFVLQLTTAIAIIEAILYGPTLIPFLLAQKADGAWATLLPPVWFASLYDWMVGPLNPDAGPYARLAMLTLIGVFAAAIALYLLPARLMARRALESLARRRAGRLTLIVHAISAVLRLRPAVAGLFKFTLVSLTRSPRHLMIVAFYLGAGIALGAVSVITANLRHALLAAPQAATLTFPLAVIFMVTFGFRAAFNIPTDLVANWPLRLLAPSLHDARAAARIVIMAFGVTPIVVVTMLVARVVGWPWSATLAVGAFDFLTGALLVDGVFYAWPKVPFACANPPRADSVRLNWLLLLVALNVFAARGADLQLLALSAARGPAIYIAGVLVAIVVMRIASYREARRRWIEFDGPPETTMQSLNLSEALR